MNFEHGNLFSPKGKVLVYARNPNTKRFHVRAYSTNRDDLETLIEDINPIVASFNDETKEFRKNLNEQFGSYSEEKDPRSSFLSSREKIFEIAELHKTDVIDVGTVADESFDEAVESLLYHGLLWYKSICKTKISLKGKSFDRGSLGELRGDAIIYLASDKEHSGIVLTQDPRKIELLLEAVKQFNKVLLQDQKAAFIQNCFFNFFKDGKTIAELGEKFDLDIICGGASNKKSLSTDVVALFSLRAIYDLNYERVKKPIVDENQQLIYVINKLSNWLVEAVKQENISRKQEIVLALADLGSGKSYEKEVKELVKFLRTYGKENDFIAKQYCDLILARKEENREIYTLIRKDIEHDVRERLEELKREAENFEKDFFG